MRTAIPVTGAPRSGLPPHRALRTRPDDGALAAVVERQRIAGRLHDEVSPLLFALASGLHRAGLPDAGPDELRAALLGAVDQVTEVADRLRDVLRAAAPAGPADGVPAAAQRDVEDFMGRTGVAARLRLRGAARRVPPAAERTLLAVLRLALSNVERHAHAAAVDVSLHYLPDHVALAVTDDGCGVPAGFEAPALPESDRRWGLVSITRQVEQLGGEVALTPEPGGGTRLRVRVPA